MNKKITCGLSSIAITLLAACNSNHPEAIVPINKTITIAQPGDARTLDPHHSNDGLSLRINRQIYSRLVESDGDMKIVPGVATTWQQIDPVTTEFQLRKDIKFHDGSKLTADDVQFSLQRMMASPRIAFVMPPIKDVKVIDEHTIQIITHQPFAPLLHHLAHPALAIVSRKQVEKWGDQYMNHPVGTGPYQFSEWRKGDQIVLTRFDDYFKEPAAFKEIIFRSVVEDSLRTIGLETGEIDIALDINPIDKIILQKNDQLALLQEESLSYIYLGFNNNKEPFTNRDLRLAINYAIDRQAIIDVAMNGVANVATSPIAPGVFGFTEETSPYTYDIDKAKTYFAQSGYEQGLTIELTIAEGNRDRQIAEIIQAQLRKIGIQVAINTLESGTFWELTGAGNHEMLLTSWGTVTGDADYGLYAMYHSNARGAAGNRTFYHNPEVDRLLDAGKAEIDLTKRLDIYRRAQQMIIADAPDVMLFNSVILVGTQADIEGLNLHPVTLHDLYPLTLGKS